MKIKENHNRSCFAFFAVLLFALFFHGDAKAQFYSGSQMSFGKNRVQYNDLYWSFFRYDRFDTYCYLGGKNLAVYTSQLANRIIEETEKFLDYNTEGRFQFIVYNRMSDLKQTNVGLISDEQYNTGGVTYIQGNKMLLYYNGDHRDFERQIRAGIAQVIINRFLFGEKISSMVKNATLLTLPEWYMRGLVSYLSCEWDEDIDNRVRDGILSCNYEKFNNLTGEDAVYAGHSIWRFIIDKYGKSFIPNILYYTKISRNVESGFLYVLGISFKNLTREWLDYYDKQYYEQDKERTISEGKPLLKKFKKNTVYQRPSVSPDGSHIAYVTNEMGKYKILLYNNEKGKKRKLSRFGYKLDEKVDYTYPLLAWHPTSKIISVITEKKGKVFLTLYNTENKGKEVIRLFYMDKILSFSYSQDGKMIAISGVQNGQTDIYIYNFLSRTYEQITKDEYDDFTPCFLYDSKFIAFSSTRTNDTLNVDVTRRAQKNTDLFLYNHTLKSPVLKRLTNTPADNEMSPQQLNKKYYTFLNNGNGIYNRYAGRIDSVITFVDTIEHYACNYTAVPLSNYSRNIVDQSISPEKGLFAESIFHDGRFRIFTGTLNLTDSLSSVFGSNTTFRQRYLKNFYKSAKDSAAQQPKEEKKKKKKLTNVYYDPGVPNTDTGRININDYRFGDPGKNKVVAKDTIVTVVPDTQKVVKKVNRDSILNMFIPKQQNYDVAYFVSQLVNQVDFSFLNSTYQPFTGGGNPVYLNPGFNAFLKVGVSDVFEDYRITGGMRLSVNMNNNEYLFSYEKLKKRLDKQLILHRQGIEGYSDYTIIKQHTHEARYILKWPFDPVRSLRGTILGRADRYVFKSTDYFNLIEPNYNYYWAGVKGEFVFDNTRTKGVNLYYGTRYKIFAEWYRQVNKEKTNLYVIGFDYRHYQKIHKTFIWANRLAGSTSWGDEKLIYYMGGVDNWLAPKFNTDITVPMDQNFAYQTLATNMRGFTQNIRNGNTFVLANSELRFPVFRYLMNKPLKSDFLTNFQVVGFGDIGTAWVGKNPYDEDNPLYTQIIVNGPMVITLKNVEDPIVGGYGFGLRSRVLGYFLRFDVAWGVQDRVIQKAVKYFSLSLDF
ncbi:MAG: hypothetical protein V2A54_05540 [Bacteroidota bacterium]